VNEPTTFQKNLEMNSKKFGDERSTFHKINLEMSLDIPKNLEIGAARFVRLFRWCAEKRSFGLERHTSAANSVSATIEMVTPTLGKKMPRRNRGKLKGVAMIAETERWALGADEVQWILYRARRPVAARAGGRSRAIGTRCRS